MGARTQVFVSYSHADSEHLLRLKVHLRPYERKGLIDLWADTRIKTGQQWKIEIEAALGRAAVAILLVSADFLASDFVAENELPPLLEAANKEGVRILPVILKPCAFATIASISVYQALNDPARPLIALEEADREALWVQLGEQVEASLREFRELPAPSTPVSSAPESIFGEFRWAQELIREEISAPERIQEFRVYQYQHVDLLDLMPLAAAVLQSIPNANAVLQTVKKRFILAGWEGDGEIRIMWFPPFVGAGVEDTWGVAAWFVKQDNNGTAFIASPVPLLFPRLLEQQPPGGYGLP